MKKAAHAAFFYAYTSEFLVPLPSFLIIPGIEQAIIIVNDLPNNHYNVWVVGL